MSNTYLHCILYVSRNFVQCSDSFHTHWFMSAATPSKHTVESAWLLSQICYRSKTSWHCIFHCISFHYQLFSFFLLLIIIHILLSHMSKHGLHLHVFTACVLILHIGFFLIKRIVTWNMITTEFRKCKVETKHWIFCFSSVFLLSRTTVPLSCNPQSISSVKKMAVTWLSCTNRHFM